MLHVSLTITFALLAACAPASTRYSADASTIPAEPETPPHTEVQLEILEAMDSVLGPAIGPDARDDRSRCVGAVAVVIANDEAVIRGYGATEAEGSIAPEATTLFQIGSLSKVFTGLALARAVTEQQLPASTPVSAILRSDLATAIPPDTLSLVSLVTHHSGLPTMPTNLVDRDYDGIPEPDADWANPALGYTRSHLKAFLQTWQPTTTEYRYSNAGIGLLGIALQDHHNHSDYNALLHEQVTDDLDMHQTWGNVRSIPTEVWNARAQGYASAGGQYGEGRVVARLGQMGILASAGEVTTTATDMKLFLEAMMGLRSTALEQAISLAQAPAQSGLDSDQMGYGIEIESTDKGTVYKKSGSTSSYSAYLMFRRGDTPAGIAILTNCGGFKVKPLAVDIFAEL